MTFMLSIEYEPGVSDRIGYLGDDEAAARTVCVERYRARTEAGLPTYTVGLISGTGRRAKVVDVFDGERWASEIDCFSDREIDAATGGLGTPDYGDL